MVFEVESSCSGTPSRGQTVASNYQRDCKSSTVPRQVDLAAAHSQAMQLGLTKSGLLLDHADDVLTSGVDVSFGCLDQIQ